MWQTSISFLGPLFSNAFRMLNNLMLHRYDPVFTQMYSTTLTVRQITFWEALRQAGSYPELSPPEGIETFPLLDFVKDMHKSGSGPVVIFPEVKIGSQRKETTCCEKFSQNSQNYRL